MFEVPNWAYPPYGNYIKLQKEINDLYTLIKDLPIFDPNDTTLTGTTKVEKLDINNSAKIVKVYDSTVETQYTDDSLLTSLKIKNILDDIPTFDPNDTTLTGITIMDRFKLHIGPVINSVIDNADSSSSNSILTSSATSQRIGAALDFFTANANFTGNTGIEALFIGNSEFDIDGLRKLASLNFFNNEANVIGICQSIDNDYNDNKLITSLKVKNMIDASPIFNPNNLVLTGTTSVEKIDIDGVIINGVTNTNSETYSDNYLITSLKVKDMISEVPTFDPFNTKLTGSTTVHELVFGAGVLYLNQNGIYQLGGLRFLDQTNPLRKFYISTDNTFDDQSVLSGLKVKNMIDSMHPIKSTITVDSTFDISTLPGTWSRIGVQGYRMLIAYNILIHIIYQNTIVRCVFVPSEASTTAGRHISWTSMGIPSSTSKWFSNDFVKVTTPLNKYLFHDKQTSMLIDIGELTVVENTIRSWELSFIIDPTITFTYTDCQNIYKRTS